MASAQFALGLSYVIGEGVSEDNAEAVKWFRKAADQGLASAQLSLGVCYKDGKGVPKDFVVAYKWLLLAGGQGQTDAKEAIDKLEKQLTPAQITEGQKHAREFVPAKGGK